jgi:hypothetical protein
VASVREADVERRVGDDGVDSLKRRQDVETVGEVERGAADGDGAGDDDVAVGEGTGAFPSAKACGVVRIDGR